MDVSVGVERKKKTVCGGGRGGERHEGREKNEKAKSSLLSLNDGACCDFVSTAGTREKLGAKTFSVPSAAER